jgi:hypothetical protein
MRKTKYMFDSPVKRDWLFWVFCLFLFANTVNALQRVSDSGGIDLSGISVVSGSIDAFFQVLISWIMCLPIYFIRKIIRKRSNQGFAENQLDSESSLSSDSESYEPNPSGTKNKKILISVGIAVLVVVSLVVSGDDAGDESDKFFEVEQLINEQVKEWNIAATPISQIVSRISNGTVSEVEARQVAGEASTNFAVIHNNLRDACAYIPDYDVNAGGKEGAIALSYDALQVTCDLLPQESIEILALVAAQLSPISTQADLDYHSNQIASLIEQRKTAISKSIDALEPFATEAEKEQLARLRVMLG